MAKQDKYDDMSWAEMDDLDNPWLEGDDDDYEDEEDEN